MSGVAPSRGGSNATTIGMVIAIAVAVILAGVLIWLYTLQEELRATADAATQQRQRVVVGGEENELKRIYPNAAGSESLAGSTIRGSKLVIARLSGDETLSAENAVNAMEATLAKIRDEKRVSDPAEYTAALGAVTIIDRLHGEYAAALDRLKETQAALDQANLGLEEARAANVKLEEDFKAFMARVNGQIDELQQAKLAYESTRTEEVNASLAKLADMRGNLNDIRERAQKMQTEFQTAYAEQLSLLGEQRAALADIKGPVADPAAPLASSRKPIGRVLRNLPGNSLLYIDLGRKDGVALGMTFSVYSEDEAIPLNGRGKASIEVVSVNPRTSECRIVSPPSPDNPILEGDGVNNILLSRTRGKQQTFVVVGDFDVDFDGQPDPRGRESIVRHIERMGGRVVDEVSPLTDFLVIGAEPRGQDVLAGLGAPPASGTRIAPPADKANEAAAETEDAAAEEEAETEEAAEEEAEDEDDWGGDWGEEPAGSDNGNDNGSGEESGGDDNANDNGSDEEDDWSWDRVFNGGDGGPGAMATIKRTPEIDPTVPTLKRRYKNEAERARDSLWRAKNFSVPVLTQEQFFNYVGIEGTRSDVRRLQG